MNDPTPNAESANWTPTADALPPEGRVVLTMDSGGRVQQLKRRGSLWFVPDGSLYVYYVPAFWQELNA